MDGAASSNEGDQRETGGASSKAKSEMISTPEALFCDGGVCGRNPSKIGGTWAWCLVNIEQNARVRSDSGFVPVVKNPITNNHTEMIAIIKALEAMPPGWSGTVCTDSNVARVRVFCAKKKSKTTPQGMWDRAIAAKARLGRLRVVLLNGHPTSAQLETGIGHGGLPVSEHNKWCDEACGRAKKLQA